MGHSRSVSWVLMIFLLLVNGSPTEGKVKILGGQDLDRLPHAQSIHVHVTASTWKPRGRFNYDIEGSVLVKLASVGFEVVRQEQAPHDMTLFVDYQESRGKTYGINQFGTVIDATFRLDHREIGPILEVTVQEASSPTLMGTPPHLDALRNFQTDPYYYFLGDILWGRVQKNQDVRGVFIEGLRRLRAEKKRDIHASETLGTRFDNPDHSMVSSQKLYAAVAIQHTIDEFVQAHEIRAIPVLIDLLDYPDVYVKVRAIKALGAFQAEEAMPVLRALTEQDREVKVRQAAKSVLETLIESGLAQSP